MFLSMKNPLSTRYGVLAAVLGLAVAMPAVAEDRALALNYEIELAGTSGNKVDTLTRLVDDRYAIDAEARKYGILGTLTGSYRTQVSSRGKFGANALAVLASTGHLKTGDEDRRFTFSYGPEGKVSYGSQPALDIKTGREVSDEQKRGSYDPLTASIVALLTRTDPCAGPLPIFDGRRRFDLLIDRKGSERVPEGKELGIKEDGVRCDVRMKRIAGYKPGTDSDTEFKKPAKLWLARLDDSGRLYPVRVEIDIGIGSLIARLVKFDQRPLTPEEKASLTR
jgi:hypothetical protein